MSFSYSPKIVTNGLIVYLDAGNRKSYSQSGNTWYDLSKTNNDATLVNGTSFSNINLGGMTFDGVNDEVSVGKANVSSAFTINMWFKATGNGSTGSAGYLGLVNRFNGVLGTSNQRNRFLLAGTTFNFLFFQALVSGVTYDIISDTFTSVLSGNTMASVTFDGSNVRMYINGQSVMATPFVLPGPLDTGTQIPIIGRGAGSADYYFNGYVYTYQVYTRALSQNEIIQNYNALKGRFNL